MPVIYETPPKAGSEHYTESILPAKIGNVKNKSTKHAAKTGK